MNKRKLKKCIYIAAGVILLLFSSVWGTACALLDPEMNIGKKEMLSKEAKEYIDRVYGDVEGTLRDHHIHVVGMENCGKGNFVNPEMQTWLHPVKHIKFIAYKKASGIKNMDTADSDYIGRLRELAELTPGKGKYHIFAFDKFYDPDGKENLHNTEFYTSNEYVYSLYEKNPNLFVPVVSINPYRKDALEELKKYAEKGVEYVKWLPNAMGIDPSDDSLEAFYKKLLEYEMVLLTHTGREDAVDGEEYQKLGNPLLLRKPLDMGVMIIMAHCASTGNDIDLDDPQGKTVPSFELFLRMMDDEKYKENLYADISAVTQFNRRPEVLKTLLQRTDLHPRLVNGSDYPLPAINILIQTKYLVRHGFITPKERKILNEIYKYNPLIFDYAVKRTVKDPETGEIFSKKIFTRDLKK